MEATTARMKGLISVRYEFICDDCGMLLSDGSRIALFLSVGLLFYALNLRVGSRTEQKPNCKLDASLPKPEQWWHETARSAVCTNL
jgi:hypothetical protein